MAHADNYLSRVSNTETRALFRVVILGFIAAAAIASRLFSVISKLEYDPRGTKGNT